METGTNYSRPWAELSGLDGAHSGVLALALGTDSWAVLKGLTLWLGQWEAKGQMIVNKSLGVRMCGKTPSRSSLPWLIRRCAVLCA